MTTVSELKAAKQAGREAFAQGVIPDAHPSEVPGELYEAWFDGWDEANTEAADLEEF
jgi:hypothetical protein